MSEDSILEDIYGMINKKVKTEEVNKAYEAYLTHQFKDYLKQVYNENKEKDKRKAEKARIILADIYQDPKYWKSGGRNKRSLNRKSGSRLTLKKRRRRRIMTSTACRNRGK